MTYPVTVPEALDHLRIPSDDITTPEWLEVERMIATATEWTEAYCKRAWMSGSKTKLFDELPSSAWKHKNFLLLTGGVVSSVQTVTYYDTAYVQQTIDSADYRLVVNNGVSYLYPGMGKEWPTDGSAEPLNVQVDFTVGDVNAADVPASVKSAILLIVGSLFENREQGVIQAGVSSSVQAPVAAQALLFPLILQYC